MNEQEPKPKGDTSRYGIPDPEPPRPPMASMPPSGVVRFFRDMVCGEHGPDCIHAPRNAVQTFWIPTEQDIANILAGGHISVFLVQDTAEKVVPAIGVSVMMP